MIRVMLLVGGDSDCTQSLSGYSKVIGLRACASAVLVKYSLAKLFFTLGVRE